MSCNKRFAREAARFNWKNKPIPWALLLPAAVFIFIMAFAMYVSGDKKR